MAASNLSRRKPTLIVNKQPGVIVHPTKGHPQHTIANGVMKYMIDSGQSFKVRFANRIDMDTTGSLLVCKNDRAHMSIASQLKEHTINRVYTCIVHGVMKDDFGSITEEERAGMESCAILRLRIIPAVSELFSGLKTSSM